MAPADAVSVSFDSLTPAAVAQVLRHVGPSPQSVPGTVPGAKVIVLTDGGVRYTITASTPHRLIHVSGGSGVTAYSFDVQPLTATTIKPVFATLRGDVQNLRGAADPQAVVDGGTPKFLDCNGAARCTVSSTVTVTDPGNGGPSPSGSSVLVKMTVGFSGSQNGKPFTTCSVTVAVPSSAPVKPGCGVSGSAWSTWFNSHNGHFNVWAAANYAVSVNSASDISALQSDLGQEQGAG
jgi:hypothetical protein